MKKFLVVLLGSVLIATAFAADSSWTDIQKKGKLVLGFDDAFPPMGFRDGKELVGFDIDLAKEVAKRLKIQLVLQPILWDVKEQELNTKKIDCIWNGFTITPAREKELTFTRPYMNNKQVIFVPINSPIKTLADLKGKTLALQRDSSASEALEKYPQLKKDAKKVLEFEDYLQAVTDLDSGATDAVLIDIIVASYRFVEKNPGKYRILEESIADETFGIGFRKTDVALKNKIEETLVQMAKDGTTAKISTKWFGSDITILK